MSDRNERAVTRALGEYSQALQAMLPSPELDARVDSAIREWAQESATRRLVRQPVLWAAAVASIAVISGGIALLVRAGGETQRRPAAATSTAAPHRDVQPGTLPLHNADVSALAGGQSLWPAEAAIFRVRASLPASASAPATGGADGERQYWVDVRIANDGTMRIMQVIPADPARVVPLE